MLKFRLQIIVAGKIVFSGHADDAMHLEVCDSNLPAGERQRSEWDVDWMEWRAIESFPNIGGTLRPAPEPEGNGFDNPGD